MRKLFLIFMLLPCLAWAAPTPATVPLSIDGAGNLKPDRPIIPSTKNLLVGRDANGNITANNTITGIGDVTTTGSTTELTMKSPRTTRFTGTAAQSVSLPLTSTLSKGEQFVIINDSSAIVTVTTSAANSILALAPLTQAEFTARSTTSNAAAAWKYHYDAVIFGVTGKSLTVSNTLTFIGTDGTTMTYPTTSATLARIDAANNFLGVNKMENMAYSSPTPHGDCGSTETFSALKEAHTVTLNIDSTWTFTDFAPFGGNHIWISLQVLQKGGFTPTFPQAVRQPQINPDADSTTLFTAETWDGGTTFFVSSDYIGIVSPQQIQAKALPATNENMSGALTITGLNAGATLAQWDAVYLGSGGTWLLGDANGANTYPARGLATSAVNTATSVPVLIQGSVRHNAWNWTIGAPIYLSETAGAITQTAPVIPGSKIQQVGWALTADSAYFDFGGTGGITVASGTPSPTPTATATATATPTTPPAATPTATATATPTATATATATPTATPDLLVNQNFEGTGYDNGETWSPGGAGTNPDYTGVILRGSQSLRVLNGWSKTNFTGQTNVWGFVEFQVASFPSSGEAIAGIIFDTGTVGVWVTLDSTGHVKISDNSSGVVVSSAASASTLSTGVHYYCWLHAVNGGTNTLYISTSTTRPSDGNDGVAGAVVVTVANSSSGSYNQFYLYHSGTLATDITYDHAQVSANSIGNNP